IDIGWRYTYVNIDSSRAYNDMALLYSKKADKADMIASSLNNIGIDYYVQGNIQQMIKYLDESYHMHRKLGNKYGMFQTKTNIGAAYNLLKQNDLALKCFLEARQLAIDMKRSELLPGVNLNIASMYIEKKETGPVKSMLEEVIREGEKRHDRMLEATALSVYAQYYRLKNELDSALKYYEKSYGMLLDIHQEINGISDLNHMAEIYLQKKQPEQALMHATKALDLAMKDNLITEITNAYAQLANIYEYKEDYRKAFDNFVLYKQYGDSLFNSENTKAMSDLKTKYEVELKEKELNAKAEAKAEAKEKQNRIVMLAAGLIIVLVSVFSVILLRKFRQAKQQQRVIAEQYQLGEARSKEIAVKNTELEIKNKEIMDSIHYAENIQNALLPNAALLSSALRDYFILFQPKDIIAGDFYWVKAVSADEVYFAVGDCTGHGVPGALMSVLGMNLLEAIFKETTRPQPSEVLNQLRSRLILSLENSDDQASLRDGMDIAIACINFKTKKCMLSMANNPVLIIRNGEVIKISPDKMPVGLSLTMQEPFTQKEIDLQSGDVLYLFTDGFRDQFGGEKGKKFKFSKFTELLQAHHKHGLPAQKELLARFIAEWKNVLEQTDDICVAGIKIQ
ncbi:MAG: SpoIIE family protein phosphatase, partial [Bacteroidia bacterium]